MKTVTIGVNYDGQFKMRFAYDEDTSDLDAYFENFENTQFNGLVK